MRQWLDNVLSLVAGVVVGTATLLLIDVFGPYSGTFFAVAIVVGVVVATMRVVVCRRRMRQGTRDSTTHEDSGLTPDEENQADQSDLPPSYDVVTTKPPPYHLLTNDRHGIRYAPLPSMVLPCLPLDLQAPPSYSEAVPSCSGVMGSRNSISCVIEMDVLGSLTVSEDSTVSDVCAAVLENSTMSDECTTVSENSTLSEACVSVAKGCSTVSEVSTVSNACATASESCDNVLEVSTVSNACTNVPENSPLSDTCTTDSCTSTSEAYVTASKKNTVPDDVNIVGAATEEAKLVVDDSTSLCSGVVRSCNSEDMDAKVYGQISKETMGMNEGDEVSVVVSNAVDVVSKESDAVLDVSGESHAVFDVSEESHALQNLSGESHALLDVSEKSHALLDVSDKSHALLEVSDESHALLDVSDKSHALLDVSEESHALLDISQSSDLMPSVKDTDVMACGTVLEGRGFVDEVDVDLDKMGAVVKVVDSKSEEVDTTKVDTMMCGVVSDR